MARIFSIRFFYNGTTQHAMVTVRTTPFFIEYGLANLPPEIRSLLPGNTIISPYPTKFFFLNTGPEHSVPLMKALIKAVEEHLEATAEADNLKSIDNQAR